MMPLKMKKDELSTKRTAIRNSFIGIAQFREMNSHLSCMPLKAKSKGMLVKRDMASNETKEKPSSIVTLSSLPTSSKLFLMEELACGRLLCRILCRNLANEYRGL